MGSVFPQDADFPWQMGRPFRLGLVVGRASNVNYPYLLCFVGLKNDFYESEVVLPKRPYSKDTTNSDRLKKDRKNTPFSCC